MKKVISILFTTSILICCSKKNDDSQKGILIKKSFSVVENDTNVKKSDSSKIIEKKIKDEILGKWFFKDNGDGYSYTLTISKENNDIYVNYCFVKGQAGDQIDCPDEKVKGIYINEQLEVDFISAFDENPIKCILKLEKHILKLTTSNSGASLFFEEMEFVQKK